MNDEARHDAFEATKAAPNADENVKDDVTAVKDEIARLSQQIAEAVNTFGAIAKSEAKRGLQRARANVDAVASEASDRAGAVADAAQGAASSIEHSFADAIQERPLATLALALGIGFFIGVTWRR
jgi:ElaB/YqjD/DUF883 family membrane-anchored ribosome-binding protein